MPSTMRMKHHYFTQRGIILITFIHTCSYTLIHTCIHAYIYSYIYIHIHTYSYIFIHIHIYSHILLHTYSWFISKNSSSNNNEDIGEGTPVHPDGSCNHPFLVPNMKRTQCVLPGRIDVGKHFILSGGCDGIRENFNQMIHRLSFTFIHNNIHWM